MNWKTLYTRTGTAIVFGIIMLIGLLGPAELFSILFAVVQFLCIKEYFLLIEKINPEYKFSKSLKYSVQVVAAIMVMMISPLMQLPLSCLSIVIAFPIIYLLITVINSSPSQFASGFVLLGAFLYITLPIACLILMREKSLVLPLGLIVSIWINDTMAYLVGSFIGKTPFSEISPKKTWEGTIGGALLTVIVAAIYGYFSPYYNIQQWILLALCAAIAGTIGDLFESKLKRLANVKDSGNFMPGHGGALDRFDSLLVATPFAFVTVYLFVESLNVVLF
jgi:phosphatidate cytidylyltransferase